MKSTTCFVEITNQKAEKYLRQENYNPLTSSPARLLSTKKFSGWIYWKLFCRFWPINPTQFIWHDIGLSYFSRNLLLLFLLWYDFKIQVESRGGGTFLCLASSVNVQQKLFFFLKLKAKCPVFLFLDLSGTILNLI